MKQSIISKSKFDIYFCFPRITIIAIDKEIDDLQIGLQVRDLDTVCYFSKYDYGYIFEITILGIGFSIWVARNLL